MEYVRQKVWTLKYVLPVLLLLGVAFSLVTVVYGFDSVAQGVHDTFHDFRHVVGMPCH